MMLKAVFVGFTLVSAFVVSATGAISRHAETTLETSVLDHSHALEDKYV